MEQFKFSLQKLLDIRIDKEEQSKISFMEAQRLKKLAEDKLNNLQETYEHYKTADNALSVVERKIKNNYLSALNKNITNAKKELINTDKTVEIRRQDFRNKQIERKTVEIIKDKKLESFKKEVERQEQVQNDEFALYSFIRNNERG